MSSKNLKTNDLYQGEGKANFTFGHWRHSFAGFFCLQTPEGAGAISST